MKNLDKRYLKDNLKNEKGSITMFVLLTCLFFLVIVISVNVHLKNKETAMDEQYAVVKNRYEQDVGREETIYDETMQYLLYGEPKDTPTPALSATVTELNRQIGTIDIVFLKDTGYMASDEPNAPSLDNTMVPVYFDNSSSKWIVCSAEDTEKWYNYEEQATTTETTGTSRWANVMLTDDIVVEKDGTTYDAATIKTLLTNNNLETIVGAKVTQEGSMLVWIPRYAYKITYFDNDTNKNAWIADNSSTTGIIGYSDSRGIVTVDGETPSTYNTPVTSINVIKVEGNKLSQYYRPHPAFERELDQGGWDTELTGIWVGKFETTGSIQQITTKSNTSAIRDEAIGIIWNAIKNNFKAGTTESHMMKNSEWGAVAYLTESKYGRNATEVDRNTNSSYYTGGSNTAGEYISNILQTTTGNVYGIYDTVGCTSEYVASYIANSQTSYGYQFASKDGQSTSLNDNNVSSKYATVYKYDTTSDNYTNNYNINLNKVFGDAIIENSTDGTGVKSWYFQTGRYAEESYPFFDRGGYYGYIASYTVPGTFYFSGIHGGSALRTGKSCGMCSRII